MLDRRPSLAASPAAVLRVGRLRAPGYGKSGLLTRGVVLVAEVLTLTDRPERAMEPGSRPSASTIRTRHRRSSIGSGARSTSGSSWRAKRLGLMAGYETHAMRSR